jgi:uncharacterized protein
MPEQQGRPVFGELDRAACEALLARGHTGRLAYSFHDRVDIEPIGYVYADGTLYGRTSPGAKLTTIEHHRWVAFEVDEVRSQFDWDSVVVRGTLYVVTNESGSAPARATWARTLAALRTLIPATLEADDPTPHRTVLFRIHVDAMTGRSARPAADA